MRFCGTCGQGLQEGARFCTSCGSPAGDMPGYAGAEPAATQVIDPKDAGYSQGEIAAGNEPVLTPTGKPVNRRSRIIKWTLASILALILAGAGFWGWQVRASQGTIEGRLDLAVKYLSENKYDKAVLAYNEAIKIDPREVKAYQGLAKTYALQGKYQDAETAYQQGLNAVADENKPVLKLGLAGLSVDKSDLSEAKQRFRVLITDNARLIEAYRGLAAVYESEGEIAAAQEVLETAVKYNPGDYRAYNGLSGFYARHNDQERACSNLLKSLDLELNQEEAYTILTGLFNGRWSRITDGSLASTNARTTAMLKFFALATQQQYQAALACYNSSLAQDSDNMKAKVLAAVCLLNSGDKTGAAQLIQTIAGQPMNACIIAETADYYRLSGDVKLAVQWAGKSLGMNADNLTALRVLAAIYSDANARDNQKMARLTASRLLAYSTQPVKVIVSWLAEHNIQLPMPVSNPDLIKGLDSAQAKTALKENYAQIVNRLKALAIYQYEMRDNQGQVYNVFIYAEDTKTRLADGVDVVQTVSRGDVLKTGQFQVGYIKKDSDELKTYRGEYFAKEHTFDVSAYEMRFFKNLDASQPDLLLVGSPASSQAYMFHIYMIKDGQWTLVQFDSQGKIFDSTAAQAKKDGPAFIQVAPDLFESGLHNNAGPEGESLDSWKLDVQQNLFHFVANRKISFEEWRSFMGF